MYLFVVELTELDRRTEIMYIFTTYNLCMRGRG
jgi:hypothetical protein